MDTTLTRRYRRGMIWRGLFFLATAWAMLILVLFLLNVINGAFGMTLIQDTIPRAELAVDGVAVEALTPQQLIAHLDANASRGLMRRFESEQPLVGRSQAELYRLVEERVIEPHIIESWTLFQTLFRRHEIEATFAALDKEAQAASQLRFRSWLNPQFLTRAQSPQAGVGGCAPSPAWLALDDGAYHIICLPNRHRGRHLSGGICRR